MKTIFGFFILFIAFCSLAHADDIFSRFGADGPISKRFSEDTKQYDIVVIDGKQYRVPRDNRRSYQDDQSTVNNGAVNPRNGDYYPSVGDGMVVDPKTGRVFSAP